MWWLKVDVLGSKATDAPVAHVQWGPVEYHERSLANLAEAMQRTKRLCATVLDTVGREIMVLRPYALDEVRPKTFHTSWEAAVSPCSLSAGIQVCPSLSKSLS